MQNVILKSTNSANAVNIQRNLFSEIAVKSFKESYRFDNDVVLQAQQTIRDFYINPTAISTLTKSINSSYPINQMTLIVNTMNLSMLSNKITHILLKRLYVGQAEL